MFSPSRFIIIYTKLLYYYCNIFVLSRFSLSYTVVILQSQQTLNKKLYYEHSSIEKNDFFKV